MMSPAKGPYAMRNVRSIRRFAHAASNPMQRTVSLGIPPWSSSTRYVISAPQRPHRRCAIISKRIMVLPERSASSITAAGNQRGVGLSSVVVVKWNSHKNDWSTISDTGGKALRP